MICRDTWKTKDYRPAVNSGGELITDKPAILEVKYGKDKE
jgi:hypothetical protein